MRLVEHLQSGRPFTSAQLAEFCGVTRRTIFRDLKTLQNSGVAVLYDNEKQGYWLSGPAYLPPTDLTLPETLALLLVSHELGEARGGLQHLAAARTASLKLLSNLPGQLRTHVGETLEAVDIRLPQAATRDRTHFDRMLEAVRARRRTRIVYDSIADGKKIQTLLSPYRLFFRHRNWYVIGRSSLHRSVRTFHLGRFVDSQLVEEHYDVPPRFSLDRYLGNAWGVIRDPHTVHVLVRFQPLVARNVMESQWHRTQRMEWNADGTLDFHADVDGLREIQWWILGYGDQAEAIEPPELRDIVKQRVAALHDRYQSGMKSKKK